MMQKTIKILYVNGGLMDYGGISSVILNYYKHIDTNLIKIDFLGQGVGNGERDAEILNSGGKVFNILPKSKGYIQNTKMLKRVIEIGEYDIVHAHSDSGNTHILRVAKDCGVNVRISHSHNTNYTIKSRIRILINDFQKYFIFKYATDMWACSKAAGKWMYGKKHKYSIIRNAIEVDNYLFSREARKQIRNKYNLDREVLIGVVGRIEHRKNQEFLLSILDKLIKRNHLIKLMIVGEGNLKKSLMDYVSNNRLDDYVIFTGIVNDTEKYYSAFDVFAMPSLFEGLPVCAIEAQCNGLPCVFSSCITDEVNILSTNSFVNLERKDIWIDELLSKAESGRTSLDIKNIMKKAGYDIEYEAKKLEKKYEKMVTKKEFLHK